MHQRPRTRHSGIGRKNARVQLQLRAYPWRIQGCVRTFAQLAKHIAVDNYLSGAALLGEKPPIEPGVHENGSDSIRTKAEVIKFLRDSFIYLHKGASTMNEKNLMGEVDYPSGGRVARLSVVTAAISHPWDIYGQMIEYLRMRGIDPQK
ncbi:MAG TPA: DinB family protein [Candidatus Angelobacter sp.]|nr:DinB family protein [Candidatus Angelobacter sp.]